MSNSDPYLNLTGLEDMLAVEVRQRNRDRRERIATAALQGLLSNPRREGSILEASRVSVEYTDALIAELDKEDKR